MSKRTTVYQALLEAGCEMDNHASDLYVEYTDKACEIISAYGVKHTTFTCKDGKLWLDVPFMFDPWWEEWDKRAAERDARRTTEVVEGA